MMRRVHILIRGRVQGVSFRHHSLQNAAALHLAGWVCNTDDGNVEIVAEGTKEKIEQFIAWCRKGPSAAKVMKVDINDEEYTGEFTGFGVR